MYCQSGGPPGYHYGGAYHVHQDKKTSRTDTGHHALTHNGGVFLTATDAQAADVTKQKIYITSDNVKTDKDKTVRVGSADKNDQSNVYDNEVHLESGVSVYRIFGGQSGPANADGSVSNGTVHDNKVYITNGKVTGDENYNGVCGGFSNSNSTGGVQDNLVSITDGSVGDVNVSITKSVYGGGINYGSAKNNTVIMNGGTVGMDVYGAYSMVSASLYGNKVYITKGHIGEEVYGASSSSGNVEENEVHIGSESEDSTNSIFIGTKDNGNVYGGCSTNGNAIGNKVYVHKGYVGYDNNKPGNIIGGKSVYGIANGNEVYVYGGYVSGDVIGGAGSSAGSNKENGNRVEITGGIIRGRVIGGNAASQDTTATASYNTVTISGGSITGEVKQKNFIAGGYGRNATNNIVNISDGVTIASTLPIYGGYYENPPAPIDLVTGNTLNLTNQTLKGNAINNFDYVNLTGGSLDSNALENVNHITVKKSDSASSLTKVTAKRGTSNGLEDITIEKDAELIVAYCAVSGKDVLWMDSLLNSGTLTLKSGQLYANNFKADAESTFNVYADNVKNAAAVIGISGKVDISPSAYLVINGTVEKYGRYNILQGSGVTGSGDTPDYYYNTAKITTEDFFTFENKWDADKNIYYITAIPEDKGDIIPDHDDQPDILPAELTTVGAVSHATQSALLFMADAVLDHVAPAIELHPEPETEEDTHLWVHYSHSKEEATDRMLGSKSTSYDLQLNSYTVGRDVYQHDTDTVGIALSYAKGDAVGLGGEARTENDAEYYGFSVYGRKDDGKFTYLSDLSYIHGENDLKQKNLSRTFTGDTKSDAISLGFTAMERVDRGEHRFVPYAGLRYLNVSNKDYYDSFGMKHESDTQHILLAPVGVRYTAEIPSGDWMVKPLVDLRYTWSMGDRETNETISYGGASTSYDYLTRDSGLFSARLGVTAEKKAFAVGLAYERQVGDTVRADCFLANMNFKF